MVYLCLLSRVFACDKLIFGAISYTEIIFWVTKKLVQYKFCT
jgi:hypothetical protein